MELLYLVLTLILLWSYWEVLRKLRSGSAPTPTLGWMVGLGFFMIAPLTVVVLNGGYTMPAFFGSGRYGSFELSDERHLRTFFIVWTALLLSCLTVILFTPKRKGPGAVCKLAVDESTLKKIFFFTIALSLLDYAVTIWLHGGLDSFLASRWYVREEELFARLGDRMVLYARVAQANQMVFTAAAILLTILQIKRNKIDWMYSGLILFFLSLHMVMSGNRIFLAIYLLAFAAACWLNRSRKIILVLLAVAPAIAIMAVAWTYFRHDLSSLRENVSIYREGHLEIPAMAQVMDSFEGKNLMVLLGIVEDFGDKYDYLYGSSYVRLITSFVPRSLYPTKPQGLATFMAEIYEPGSITSLSTTVLGELYANFGILSVLGLPLFTGLIMFLDRRLTPRQNTYSVHSVGAVLNLIWFVRFPFADTVLMFMFTAILTWAFGFRRRPYRQPMLGPYDPGRGPVGLSSLAPLPAGHQLGKSSQPGHRP